MKLECLPNEILLDLFIYFNGTDLLRTFYGLNERFNLLLYKQFRSYSFQFDGISKHDFDFICQKHLPFIAKQVLALTLSDCLEAPPQIQLFFSYIPSLKIFTYLRSLSIKIHHEYQTVLQLLNTCEHLSNLNQLKFSFWSLQDSSINFQWIINKIWSLSNLISCHISIYTREEEIFCLPTIISPSIEFLTILDVSLRCHEINHLLEHTPRLKYLSISIQYIPDQILTVMTHTTLTKCKIRSINRNASSTIKYILQSMPNLYHLYINIWSELIDGHQWEQLIRNYVPKLRIFRVKMQQYVSSKDTIEKDADVLINTFRSPFWIERQWFVRCFTKKEQIYLSTRFNTHDYSNDIHPDSWQSTCPDDNLQKFYEKTTTIFDQPISADIRLPNLNEIDMKLPVNEQFWSIVPNLNQLKILSISCYADTYQSQLQTLLDQAHHLNELTIKQDSSLPIHLSFFNCKNSSVRLLHLHDSNRYFSEKECQLFIHSPLASQCEVLSIYVKNRQSILTLIKNMHHLRLLRVHCTDDRYKQALKLKKQNNELVQWLKERLPSSYMILRGLNSVSWILIWR